ncbi:MAG: hypothetical protein VKO39_12025 [Cyanobacteriota bacterium]|nr:hypothetical protein [Cyanobacteriota bacterium]
MLALHLAAPQSGVVAATVIQQPTNTARWRVVDAFQTPPPSTVLPGERDPAPRTSIIPVVNDSPQRVVASKSSLAEESLPTDPLVAGWIQPPYMIRPSLAGGVPSAYASGWGDYFISGTAATPGKTRDGVPDGSLNMGFGLGDPYRSLALEVYWGIASIKNFNTNGSVGFSASRILVNRSDLQIAVGGGMDSVYSYLTEQGKNPVNGYGSLTVSIPLRPSDPDFQQMVQFTAGGGGSNFAAIDNNFQTSNSGYYVAAGIEALPNVGVSVGRSSRSTNFNVSIIPFRRWPIFVNLLAADAFSETPYGTVGVLTVGWSDSLKTGFFAE